jgi:hypothetical protein
MLDLQVQEDVYEKIDKELLTFVEDVLLNRCSNSTERLLAYADTIEAKCKPCAVRFSWVFLGFFFAFVFCGLTLILTSHWSDAMLLF